MKLSAAKADRFVQAPDPAARAVLVFGPDTGLARERLRTLGRHVVADLDDPFRVVTLTPQQIKETPSLIADEADALSLTGGRRLVWIKDASDTVAGPLGSWLEDPGGDALVLLEAGDLGTASKLRKLCEGAERAVALPCYADAGRGLDQVIRETLRERRLEVDRDAMAFLHDHLGADRQLPRRELEKLALYKGDGGGTVTLEDAMACVGDASAMAMDDIAFAAADGRHADAQRSLDRAFREGLNAVAVLRSLARHFERLHKARALVDAGKRPDEAMKALKPPVFFRRQDAFRAQLGRWDTPRLARALTVLLEAETECKRTGTPVAAATGRALMQITQAGRARQR